MTTPDSTSVTPAVGQAIAEIVAGFPGASVDHDPDGAGGAYVVIGDVPLSAIYGQPTTWIGFHLTHTYPYADVYPHYVREDLCRADGRTLGVGMSQVVFRGRPAIQLSRRSSQPNPARNGALLKLQRVLQWLNNHP